MKVCNGRQLLIHIDLPDATALTRDQSALMFPPTFEQEAVIPQFIANPTIKFNPNQNNPLYHNQNHNNQPKPII